MTEATLLVHEGERTTAHPASVAERPEDLAAATHPLAWRILSELARSPNYPSQLARRLKVHEQKVYYHVRRLERAGLVRVVKEAADRGGVSRTLAPTARAFVLLLPGEGYVVPDRVPLAGPLQPFLDDFAKDGVLDAWIVPGATTPHGPFLTAARDTPYAAQLGLWLGARFGSRGGLAVKLDTEVKAEGFERSNLIVFGGPVANIISLDLNAHLEVSFDWAQMWRLRSGRTGQSYSEEAIGLVAKVSSPWTDGAWVLLLAGLHYPGTIASLLALTDHADDLLRGYEGGSLYRVVRGLDRDGDGRVDDVEILE